MKTKKKIVFDVDGVLSNPYDLEGNWVDYPYRRPYDFVKDFLLEIKRDFHITIQTARYMGRFNGAQFLAYAHGYKELVEWLDFWELPYDEVYMGKASADFYVDDKAVRVESSKGSSDWFALLREIRKQE